MPFEHGPQRQMAIKPSLTTRHIARAKGKGNNRVRSSSNAKFTGANVHCLGSEIVMDLLLPLDSSNFRPNYAVASSLLANNLG